MGRRNDHTREEIQAMALRAGTELLDQGGMSAVSARKIALHIDYTVGTLYLVFENLDDILLHLNYQTLQHLYDELIKRVPQKLSPLQRLKALAAAYVWFAQQYENRWRMVYEHNSLIQSELADKYRQLSQSLLLLVEQELTKLAMQNHVELDNIVREARALWGGVHGICILSLNDKLHHDNMDIQTMTDLLIDRFVASYIKEKN